MSIEQFYSLGEFWFDVSIDVAWMFLDGVNEYVDMIEEVVELCAEG